jgi:hypothetical protein
VLVFVGDGDSVEVVLQGPELDEARRMARRAAAELLTVRTA